VFIAHKKPNDDISDPIDPKQGNGGWSDWINPWTYGESFYLTFYSVTHFSSDITELREKRTAATNAVATNKASVDDYRKTMSAPKTVTNTISTLANTDIVAADIISGTVAAKMPVKVTSKGKTFSEPKNAPKIVAHEHFPGAEKLQSSIVTKRAMVNSCV
jgi:hypothetical protein